MKVFISWSGERSHAVAEALRYWLPKVIQAIQPWLSANDIEKGTRWRTDIANELEQSSIGIICLTPENLNSAWLHFEAGALSKQQRNTYVCTLLYQLDPADIQEPLAQFQTTKAQKEDIRRLIHTINNALGERRLPEIEVNESFDIWWPKFEEKLRAILAPKEQQKPQRGDREILEEILTLVREQSRLPLRQQVRGNLDIRLASTSTWSTEDAQLLLNYYTHITDPATKHMLATNEQYARAILTYLKARQEVSSSSGEKPRIGARVVAVEEEKENEDEDSYS